MKLDKHVDHMIYKAVFSVYVEMSNSCL